MINNKKSNLAMLISAVISLLLITMGLSFAYFTANIEGSETTTTIHAKSGILKIVYNGGENIDAIGIEPSNDPFGTKTFTITGTNTTNADLEYHIMLIIEENTYTEGAIKYKLNSVNKTGNGEVAPSILDLASIKVEDDEILLGNAHFSNPANNQVHTYTLEIYFPDTGIPQNEDQGKTIKAHVEIREGHILCLGDLILKKYGGKDAIEEAPANLFNSINTEQENKMYKAEDDYETSYYFRGAKNHLKNNLIFAEHQWKIVRINGDGSIRIIYNGTCPGNDCTINSTGTTTQMDGATVVFNSSYNDNKYVGYMYGSASTPTKNYGEAHKNEVNSTIKTYLDTWYTTNILGTPNESYISDTLFCGDRQLHSGTGTGSNSTDYKAYDRLYTNKTPNLKCPKQDDAFTVNDTVLGNGALDYPIGLLTADEAAMAGLLLGTGNSTNYLYTNQHFWLLSPSRFASYATVFNVLSAGNINSSSVWDTIGARGVLNLKSDTTATGTGTTSDPYIVN